MASFRAKTYVNRKEEKRLQVSGLQDDFTKLAKGDEETKAEFDKAVSVALKA